MSETCETVEIVSSAAPDGFVVINASEFDSKQHKIFETETENTQEEELITPKRGRPKGR